MSSKRKPYYHLKLSSAAFWSMPVRYLKEFFGKESYMEKPYQEGRSEMHQDIPDDNWHLPPWNRPSFEDWTLPPFPPFPPFPQFSQFSPFTLPPFPLPIEKPGVALPWHSRPRSISRVKWPGRPRIGESPEHLPPFDVQAMCSIRYSGPDCLDDGQSTKVFAASNTSGGFIWGYEISDPGYISVSNSNRSDKAEFGITAHGAPDPPVDVEICFFMAKLKTTTVSTYPTSYRSKGIGMENRPDTKTKTELLVSKCGCVTITVPCDPCIRDDYLAPSIEEDQGTLAPGTAPCASSASTKTLTVQNGAGPFTWAVSGTGFCLAYATTTGRSNILRADDTACGPATITITDYCGNSCTCIVRGTVGFWCELAEYTGTEPTVPPCLLTGTTVNEGEALIIGKYKQSEFTAPDGGGICWGACDCTRAPMPSCLAGPTPCITRGAWTAGLSISSMCSPACFYYISSGWTHYSTHVARGRYGYEWKCLC